MLSESYFSFILSEVTVLIYDEYLNPLYQLYRDNKLTKNQVLEVIVYELAMGVNKENLAKTIKLLDFIIPTNESLKSVLKKSLDSKLYETSKYDLYEHFNILYQKRKFDKIETIIMNNDEISFNLLNFKTESQLQYCYKKTIEFENIKFFKQLLMTYPCEIHPLTLITAINIGNQEIFRILQNTANVDFSSVLGSVFIDSHHYDLLRYAELYYNISFENLKQTRSLLFALTKNLRFMNYSIQFDLTCIQDIYNSQDNLSKIISRDCMNILTSKNFSYNINHLALSIMYNNSKLFNYILNKVRVTNEEIEDFDKNVLQVVILSSNLEFISKIYERDNLLIYSNDRFENNILHYLMKQDSKEVFDYIVSKISKDNLTNMYQQKNVFNESPLDLQIKYKHFDFNEFL